MITIYNFQAGYGDTFLVQVETDGEEAINILIDCGFEFKKNVLPILSMIGQAGCRLNRMIITHFDDDHIRSAEQFLKDYISIEQRVITIDQIWLNTYRHLPFPTDFSTNPSQADVIRSEAYLTDYSSKIKPFEEGDMGATQAINLGAQILKTGIAWNTDFDEKAACIESKSEIKISDHVSLLLLTPNHSMLEALKGKFINDLRAMGITATRQDFLDDAFEVYSRWLEAQRIEEGDISGNTGEVSIEKLKQMITKYEYDSDEAEGNGSSIAFVLKAEEKQLLFLADAHAEDIIVALIREFPDCESHPVVFSVIKVAHHGSFRNNKPRLFQLMDSAIYIFSTNGQHPSHVHPDVETIVQIIHRPLPVGIEQRKLYFNFKLKHLGFLDDQKYQKEFNFEPFYDQSFNI